jgi:hypothetical protein
MMTRGQKRILAALRAIGYEPRSIRWEPIGVSLEMQGPLGGWFVDDDPVGYNVGEVLLRIQEFPQWFARPRKVVTPPAVV